MEKILYFEWLMIGYVGDKLIVIKKKFKYIIFFLYIKYIVKKICNVIIGVFYLN